MWSHTTTAMCFACTCPGFLVGGGMIGIPHLMDIRGSGTRPSSSTLRRTRRMRLANRGGSSDNRAVLQGADSNARVDTHHS